MAGPFIASNARQGQSADAFTIALGALGWAVSEPARADRLLALTGLTPDDLRARATDPALLAAVIGYLEGYEPDLIACADALGVAPADLVAAGRGLA
ncbi:hypothetical protein FHS31_001550 [Sphingomonas vulcanisoli]|uniref:DUF3572 family protein n=1 Tax=Sphingomonas vulcanisoli TaxID=1658060 RepID=A0ABX0TTY3_9SPHN|nr:DUF3572 family protein [Sphingomonas vulcanisoli]NIJ07940.1 hypothetical protein [Sphingomonas vulcanisoli]